jgi:hypothetical protein
VSPLSVRYVGTAGRTSTYKVADTKVEGGEAAVILVGDGSVSPAVQCLTCPAYKCEHARAVVVFAMENE